MHAWLQYKFIGCAYYEDRCQGIPWSSNYIVLKVYSCMDTYTISCHNMLYVELDLEKVTLYGANKMHWLH